MIVVFLRNDSDHMKVEFKLFLAHFDLNLSLLFLFVIIIVLNFDPLSIISKAR